MATVKMTKEEKAALRVQAMLQGVSFEELVDSLSSEDTEDATDIEIVTDEDVTETKKKGKGTHKKSAKDVPIGSEKQTFTTQQHFVPELDKFAKLNRDLKMSVVYSDHDIPYKEQLWAIPARTVDYLLEIVKSPKIASDVAAKFGGTETDKQKAQDGEVRYFRLINYENNVSYKIKEVGYVKVDVTAQGFRTTVKVMSDVLKENHANPAKVKKNLETLVEGIEIK
jgi:hypothetical protein